MIMTEHEKKARAFLFERQKAYQLTFGKDPSTELVLRDLGAFCRKHASCFMKNDREHVLLAGRREVILRIDQHLELPQEQLWELYK